MDYSRGPKVGWLDVEGIGLIRFRLMFGSSPTTDSLCDLSQPPLGISFLICKMGVNALHSRVVKYSFMVVGKTLVPSMAP